MKKLLPFTIMFFLSIFSVYALTDACLEPGVIASVKSNYYNNPAQYLIDNNDYTHCSDEYTTHDNYFKISLPSKKPITKLNFLTVIGSVNEHNPSYILFEASNDDIEYTTLFIDNNPQINLGWYKSNTLTGSYKFYKLYIYTPVQQPIIFTLQLAYDPSTEIESDKDGILDINDNCPNVYNPDQTDSDNNGIGDVCESNLPDYQILVDKVTLLESKISTLENQSCDSRISSLEQWKTTINEKIDSILTKINNCCQQTTVPEMGVTGVVISIIASGSYSIWKRKKRKLMKINKKT